MELGTTESEQIQLAAIRLSQPLWRVHGPNNVGRAVQRYPTLLHSPSAIMEQKKCWELLTQKLDQFQTLYNSQQHATGCANGCNM